MSSLDPLASRCLVSFVLLVRRLDPRRGVSLRGADTGHALILGDAGLNGEGVLLGLGFLSRTLVGSGCGTLRGGDRGSLLPVQGALLPNAFPHWYPTNLGRGGVNELHDVILHHLDVLILCLVLPKISHELSIRIEIWIGIGEVVVGTEIQGKFEGIVADANCEARSKGGQIDVCTIYKDFVRTSCVCIAP